VVSVTSQRASQTKMKIEVESNHFEAVQNVETLRNIEKFLFRSV
jgi:hypothetical protein